MENLNAPNKEEVMELLSNLIPELDRHDLEEIQVTLASNGVTCPITGSVEWGYQTGDNSYTGGAYGYNHWGVGYIYEDVDIEDLALDLIGQIEEGLAYEQLHYDCQ
tara:strand:- start:1099 stop:1416 length:318 start_codon:yes stop_codon:yes gene_type:complete